MKRSKKAISIALGVVLAATPVALAGCSGDSYTEVTFPAQNTSYVVTSQGGSVVSYGNYMYFINGTRGYDDVNGTANLWGNVVKGALYRAELNGTTEKDETGHNVFKPQMDEECLEFKYTKGEDYFGNPVNVVNTQSIAPKTVGTSGYSRGGLFIYDNYVYFASPNNEKNKYGTVQTSRTDFFMMPLSGGEPTKLYTTGEGISTASSAYAFYKYAGAVYLVTYEDTKIVSVKIDVAKEKANDPVYFEVNASSVYFPVRDTYYSGIGTNTLEDFIYFVRNATDSDNQTSGTVIEAMRPDGTENFVVSKNGQTETIEAVRDGLFFYRTTEVTSTYIKFTNLHEMLMVHSPTYKAEQDKLPADKKTVNIPTEKFPSEIPGDVTSTYPFRDSASTNEVFLIASSGSGIRLYTNDIANPLVGTITPDTGTVLFVKDNYVYFSGSDSNYFRAPVFRHMEGWGGEPQELATSVATAGISCDYAMGYFTYFAKVDEWANAYTYFYKVDGVAGMEPQFVGVRAGSDIPSAEQIEAAKDSSSK